MLPPTRSFLSLSRRQFTQLALVVPWLAPLRQERKVTTTAAGEPHFVEPPGEITPELEKRVADLAAALAAGKTSANEILADPSSNELRPYPLFRQTIEKHPALAKAVLVPRDEPGTRLAVTLRIVHRDGSPYRGARVYAYHTSNKGWYAAEAPHVAGNSGDTRFARLFTHGICDDEGRLELATIHPLGYPRSDLPSHIHLALDGEHGESNVTEVRFEDCPRMTPAAREESLRAGFAVVPVETLADGSARCTAEFRLPAG